MEDRLLRELEENPIDSVLFIGRQVTECGFRVPGMDYKGTRMNIIEAHHTVEAEIGPLPCKDPRIAGGAVLYGRRDAGGAR